VFTDTVSGLVSSAPATAAPGPAFACSRLIADAARIAAGLLPEFKTSATLTLSVQDGSRSAGK